MATTYSSGVVTAYGAAVQAGYTGTYEEFSVLMAALPVEVSRLQNMTVVVNILPKGSSPSASYENGVLTLNIPNGGITEDELNDALENKADIIISSASGSPASFPDGANDLPMESLQAEITPMQNLNGYAKPWPAGGGDNKFEPFSGTHNGVTFTPQDDGTVKMTGRTINASWTYVHQNVALPFNGISAGDTVTLWSDTYEVVTCYEGDTNILAKSSRDGVAETFTIPANATRIRMSQYAKSTVPAAGEDFDATAKYFLAKADSFSAWTPYSNICPISGRTGLSVYVSPTQDIADATTYAVDWTSEAGTVYAGGIEVVSGSLKARPHYASYNGETLVGPWMSSMDEYAVGVTPTTGAQVVDLGGVETSYQLTAQEVNSLLGQNYVWSTSGNVAASYRADTKLYIDNKITQAIAAALNA